MALDIKKKTRLDMKGKIMVPQGVFKSMIKLNEEFDSLIETIEIMNDKELMEGVQRSRNDVKAGRFRELKNIDELDKIFGSA